MGHFNIRTQSYSSINLFQNCPMQYKLKYIDGNYSTTSTLALELGTLLHKVLEIKYGKDPATIKLDLLSILNEGYPQEKIIGLKALQNKYFEDYIATGRKSGLTYNQKLEIFKSTLNTDIYNLGEEWQVFDCELPFEIQYDKDITITGKIDRVDINPKTGDMRVIDYKSSDTVYEEKELNNALQMYIYALAIKHLYGKMPVEYIYDFILLGKQAYALTKKNYKTAMQKKLDKLIVELKENYKTLEFKPKPTPLCYWCPYNKEGCVNDKKNAGLCEYHSLWSPTNKTFAVNKVWDENTSPPIRRDDKKKEFIW